MLQPIIREDLLYYLWKTKHFDHQALKTTDGRTIEIVDYGIQNYDAGPDFANCKVKIDGTLWAGNVEMHVYSSDWERHGHELDQAYDTVILHVVYEHDRDVHTCSEQILPCLEMKERIPHYIRDNYAALIASTRWIPCEHLISKVDDSIVAFWLQRMVAERMEDKTKYLKSILDSTQGNWEETLYISLSRYLGARVNMDPFESLARVTPLHILLKNKEDLSKIEALLYGQAGMLQADWKDEYFQSLRKEYGFLAAKYSLSPIPPVSWKFAKMRPVGFPTIRISHLAQIIYLTENLFSTLLESKHSKDIYPLFVVTPSDYWMDHYRFGVSSVHKDKTLSKSFVDILIINVVSPMLFLYGKTTGNEVYCDRAISLLDTLVPEKNQITDHFKSLGIVTKSAADSQALLQLKSNYCDKKSCMSCAIGNKIVGVPK